jgi:hypothetical protein
MTANNNHPHGSHRPDRGGALLELMLVAAFIALVVVAVLGMAVRNIPTL